MPQPLNELPRYLAERSKNVKLSRAHIPALLAHPDWPGVASPRPTLLWLHGRTANKELDPGRYMRCLRAGIATCAIDLPHHGERFDEIGQRPQATLHTLQQALPEIDLVIDALADPIFAGAFDLDRLAIGGMSMGGMATLRRLCDHHPFIAAAVECTTGWLSGLYVPEKAAGEATAHGPGGTCTVVVPRWVKDRWAGEPPYDVIAQVDPSQHLEGFRPIPLLALHAETDEIIPWGQMQTFLGMLRGQYRTKGADPNLIQFQTWRDTGAPNEHAGFGKFGNEAKNAQAAFLARVFFGEGAT